MNNMSTRKSFLFFSFLIIIESSLTQNINQCQKIQCNSQLNTDVCIKVESTISFINPCPDSKICKTVVEDPVFDSYCENKNLYTFKKLPSLPCVLNEECITGECMIDKCKGYSDGEQCLSPSYCDYGKTCRKNKNSIYICLDPLKEGDKCELDTDCELDCGCMKGICTKYFSLENFEETGGLDYDADFNFCKSGYVSEVGICMNISLKNEITECSDLSPCEYEYLNENNEKNSLLLHSNCLCGYNPLGKKYCLLGSGNRNFTRYLEKLKKYHLKNENCHLSERTAEGCQKDIIFGNEQTLQQINELINAKYWGKANNRLIYAPECVFNVEFPDYNRSLDVNRIPEPIKDGKCAVYSCKKEIDGGICAKSDYKNEFEINVTLADVCSDHKKCNLRGEADDVFYNGTNIEGNCFYNILYNKYPGEKCDFDSECVYPLNNPSSQFHKCEEGHCNGMNENDICEDNSWCKVGLFCDKTKGKCKGQKGKGSKCFESKDCKNNLICRDGKCTDLFTVEDGQSVPERESYEIQRKFCKNGEVINNICVSFNDLNGTKVNDNEYKKCDYNSYCEYKVNGLENGRKKYVKCGCGYNSEGQGYCPHFHDYSKNDWNEYKKAWKSKSENNCHTESRYECYEYDKNDNFKTLKNKIENGHLFYKCVDCAKKVMDGKYINFNKNLLFILGLFILFL